MASALSKRKSVHVHAKHYKYNEDGRTAPGVCGNGYVPLSHSGNVVTRIGIHTHKACGADDIFNEYFKHAANILVDPLEKLFNKIFESGIFPRQWSTGVIIPTNKRGDVNEPSNYRGVTLISCFGKLFNSILNDRLNNGHLIITLALTRSLVLKAITAQLI